MQSDEYLRLSKACRAMAAQSLNHLQTSSVGLNSRNALPIWRMNPRSRDVNTTQSRKGGGTPWLGLSAWQESSSFPAGRRIARKKSPALGWASQFGSNAARGRQWKGPGTEYRLTLRKTHVTTWFGKVPRKKDAACGATNCAVISSGQAPGNHGRASTYDCGAGHKGLSCRDGLPLSSLGRRLSR
jgi:hypothetical protein